MSRQNEEVCHERGRRARRVGRFGTTEYGFQETLSTAIESTDKAMPPPLNAAASQKGKEYFVSNGNRKSSTKGKVQVIKMLAVVVFIFAVCWLPYRAMVMWNSFTSSSKWDPDW
uniref:Uncharacterized protein n=1 Tax=Ditylenchus dipsaci TaxID=166011 RepID=A0A915CWZ5_9BILA